MTVVLKQIHVFAGQGAGAALEAPSVCGHEAAHLTPVFPVAVPLLRVTDQSGKPIESKGCFRIGVQLCSLTPVLQGKTEVGREGNMKSSSI